MNRVISSRWLLLCVLIVGFGLRAWKFERLSVEHFDEGVYASNLFADHLGFRYPDQHLYAPPLFPALLEWALIQGGARPQAVMWVNLLLGTALIWGVWWTTRQLVRGRTGQVTVPDIRLQTSRKGKTQEPATLFCWRELSPPSGSSPVDNITPLVAAVVVAGHELMIQYSRAALTDIPVCLAMTLAVGAGVRALRSGSLMWIAVAAVCTAWGWWTKYNGWLPLAILGAGVAGWGLVSRPGWPAVRAVAIRYALVAGGALLLWLPCLQELQPYGGYAAVAANHKGYLVGWRGWWDSAVRQLSVDHFYAGWVTAGTLGLASGLMVRRFTWKQSRTALIFPIAIGLGVAAVVWGLGSLIPLGILCVLAVGCTAWGLIRGSKSLREISLSDWIVAAWVLGLLVSTPLYRAYPRLMLPGLTGLIIAASISLDEIVSRLQRGNTPEDAQPKVGLAGSTVGELTAVAGLCLLATLWGLQTSPPAWQDRRSMNRAADEVIAAAVEELKERPPATKSELDALFYIFGEPGLFYQLAARKEGPLEFVAQPASNLGMLEPGKSDPRVANFLVTGPHAPTESQQLAADSRVELVREVTLQPSDLVLLDQWAPSQLPAERYEKLQLWRVVTRE
ncbi:ArnT family glycosyltransferase [Planctomicrobium sp. SH664]|uniref:ArnT family glycosyltransferase n=1 Tax=Planctomicrobium sp. SH664 TaxID=3448125 RepID=UPI003F5B1353